MCTFQATRDQVELACIFHQFRPCISQMINQCGITKSQQYQFIQIGFFDRERHIEKAYLDKMIPKKAILFYRHVKKGEIFDKNFASSFEDYLSNAMIICYIQNSMEVGDSWWAMGHQVAFAFSNSVILWWNLLCKLLWVHYTIQTYWM